jgi:hypothetical protein
MGYSTPKKQLDLKEFLSQPAKKFPIKHFRVRKAPTAHKPDGTSTSLIRNNNEK